MPGYELDRKQASKLGNVARDRGMDFRTQDGEVCLHIGGRDVARMVPSDTGCYLECISDTPKHLLATLGDVYVAIVRDTGYDLDDRQGPKLLPTAKSNGFHTQVKPDETRLLLARQLVARATSVGKDGYRLECDSGVTAKQIERLGTVYHRIMTTIRREDEAVAAKAAAEAERKKVGATDGKKD